MVATFQTKREAEAFVKLVGGKSYGIAWTKDIKSDYTPESNSVYVREELAGGHRVLPNRSRPNIIDEPPSPPKK